MPADGDRGGVGQAARQTSPCEGVFVRLPAASRSGEAEGAGSKKRRKKGDKSKNGKEVVVVVMYTLRRGEDGQAARAAQQEVVGHVCGPQGGGAWARAEATKRGFGPETTKTVQIVVDGAKG